MIMLNPRLQKKLEGKAEFKIYEIDGMAYLIPLNWKACQVCHGFFEEYRDYRPLCLTAAMLNSLADGVREGIFSIKREQI